METKQAGEAPALNNEVAAQPAVNVSQSKKGDSVIFRCGGRAEIAEKVDINGLKLVGYAAPILDGYFSPNHWYNDGKFSREGSHPLDIIAIEPAPFDWATVKPGMAFDKPQRAGTLWYIGPDPVDENYAVFGTYRPTGGGFWGDLTFYKKISLARAPEKDVKVVVSI